MGGKKLKKSKLAKAMEKKHKECQAVKLNLACGQRKMDGYVNVDIVPGDAVDMVVDLETFPWPWEDNSIDEIDCHHYVEHTKDLIAFMNELHRILKPGCKANISAPYYTSMRAFQDPTHRRSICEATFLYFNADWRRANGLDHYSITADFDFVYGYNMDSEWAQRNEEARMFAIKHYWNVVMDIHVSLTKREMS